MPHEVARRAAPALFILVLAAPLSAQGLYWESAVTGGPAGGPKTTKSYAMPKKFRMEQEGTVIIVRLDKETLYMIDPKAKTYSEMSFADLEKAMKGMNQALEEMKKQLKDLPPEQRAIIEKQMASNPLFKAAAEPKVEVAKTAEQREIAGHTATKFVVKEDGKETMTVWAAPGIKGFEALRGDFTQMMRRTASMNPTLGKGRGQAYEKIEGFQLETEAGGIKTTVTKIEPRSTPDGEFEPPAGFTKTKPPLESLPGFKADPRAKAR